MTCLKGFSTSICEDEKRNPPLRPGVYNDLASNAGSALERNGAKMAGAKWSVIASAVLGAATVVWGQTPSVVKARMVLATSAAHPGAPAKAAVVAEIIPGYHINDHKPTLDYLIPTE